MPKTKNFVFPGTKIALIHFFLNCFLVLMLGVFLFPKISFSTTITEDNIIRLINYERVKKDLTALRKNEILNKAASGKAESIFESQSFSHDIDNKKFSAWIKDAGYEYSYVGENLAIDFVTSEGAIRAWLESPSHRDNILNERFQETGVAMKEGEFEGENTILVVQIFGRPITPLENTAVDNKPQKSISLSFLPKEASLSVGFHDNRIRAPRQENWLNINGPIRYFSLPESEAANVQKQFHIISFVNQKIKGNYYLQITALIIAISLIAGFSFKTGEKILLKLYKKMIIRIAGRKTEFPLK